MNLNVNQDKLVLGSIYGIRCYVNGSGMGLHNDRLATHVISAIINILQVDIVDPWRVLILNHTRHEHYLMMEPGDMLMYESARLLHGREGIV